MERVYSFNHGARTGPPGKDCNPCPIDRSILFSFQSASWISPVEMNYCRNLIHLQYGEIGFLTNIHIHFLLRGWQRSSALVIARLLALCPIGYSVLFVSAFFKDNITRYCIVNQTVRSVAF